METLSGISDFDKVFSISSLQSKTNDRQLSLDNQDLLNSN